MVLRSKYYNSMKQLFCRHKNKICITNIYGDCINIFGCRSIWKCVKCNKRFRSDKLNEDCKIINFTIKIRR